MRRIFGEFFMLKLKERMAFGVNEEVEKTILSTYYNSTLADELNNATNFNKWLRIDLFSSLIIMLGVCIIAINM